ncbi:hypothetical protein [Azotobacter chroococcum]|jgi:hypothetical protein|nr:hypothetical protein [Azotobacter chroococcum]
MNYQPKGGMCVACRYAKHNCSSLPFASMPVLEVEGRTIIVRCTQFQRRK